MAIIGVAALAANSGKTHLLLRLVAYFNKQQIKVAVLKHGQHISLAKGKDSSLFGDLDIPSLIVSPEGYILHAKPQPELPFKQACKILNDTADIDLLLVEGYKREQHPKLLIAKQTLTKDQLLANTIAIISDYPQNLDLPCFKPDDTAKIADFINQYIGKN